MKSFLLSNVNIIVLSINQRRKARLLFFLIDYLFYLFLVKWWNSLYQIITWNVRLPAGSCFKRDLIAPPMSPVHCKSQTMHWHCLLQNSSVSHLQIGMRETMHWPCICPLAKHFTVQTKTRTLGKSQGTLAIVDIGWWNNGADIMLFIWCVGRVVILGKIAIKKIADNTFD